MQYRMLGKTGLKLPLIGFGGIKLGGIPQSQVNKLVDMAIESGMNYIDTARVYGQSEKKLGIALKNKRDKVILSTKVITRKLEAFKRDFETSLENLQTDYVELFFLHDVSSQIAWQRIKDNKILEYISDLKREGKIGHIALSTHSISVGIEMLKTGLFEAVMLAYNPANTESEDEIIPLAKSMDIGIIIMKPYGGGILTEEGSRKLGFTIKAEESLRFAASQPDVTSVIPGLDKTEYLETAVSVSDMNFSMTSEEKEEIINKVQIRSKYFCRGCGYCLPCPEGINIPELLSLLNRWEAFKGMNWAHTHKVRREYSKFKNKADLCAGCNKCVEHCPYSLPVPDLMKKITEKIG